MRHFQPRSSGAEFGAFFATNGIEGSAVALSLCFFDQIGHPNTSGGCTEVQPPLVFL
jgi:hypothetical protein